MPLFIFLSGSFVRPFSRQLLIKTFVTLVMPLVFSASKIQL
jgi:fucose 4-O-acetylase-like acetyltransferase